MRAALAVAFLTSAVALAQDAKVAVTADVVHATTQGGTIEAGLQPMQAALGRGEAGKKYQGLKRLSTQKVTLEKKPQVLVLPNGKNAELTLIGLDKGVSTVKVKVAPSEAVLKLGHEGSLYQHAGAFQNGDLWLVLSQPK